MTASQFDALVHVITAGSACLMFALGYIGGLSSV